MNEKTKKYKSIVIVASIVAAALIGSIVYAAVKTDIKLNDGNFQVLDEYEWTLEDGTNRTVDLRNLNYYSDGHQVSVSRIFDRIDEKFCNIIFLATYQSVQIYIEDKMIYSNDTEKTVHFGKAVPSGWNEIQLPQSEKGSKIKFVFSSPYPAFVGTIDNMFYGNDNDIYKFIFRSGVNNMIVNAFVIMVGVLFILYNLIKRHKKNLDECWLGVFLIAVSLWTQFAMERITYFIGNDFINCMIAELLLLMLPIPYVVYLKYDLSGKAAVAANIILYVVSANVLVCCAFHLLGIIDLPETHWIITWEAIVILILTIVIYAPYDYKHAGERRKIIKDKVHNKRKIGKYGIKKIFNIPVYIGISIFAVFVIAEIIRFYVLQETGTGQLLRIGIMMFISVVVIGNVYGNIRYEAKRDEEEKQYQETKMQLLMGQIKPHFVYNTLGTIGALIETEPEKAEELLYSFSNYLRNNINMIDCSKLISIEEEMRYVDNYCEIEKVRFGDRFDYAFDIEDFTIQVPPFSVQPFVENAIKHGICMKKTGGMINVKCYSKNDVGHIEILDNGVGFDMGSVDTSKSKGMNNTILRLKMKLNASVDVESRIGEGTKIVISFSHIKIK